MFIDCFSEVLAFHFHVGNLLYVRDFESLWVPCVARLSLPTPIRCFLFACFAGAATDVRTCSHRSSCLLLVLWSPGCIEGEFPVRVYRNSLLETLTVFYFYPFSVYILSFGFSAVRLCVMCVEGVAGGSSHISRWIDG